MNYNKFSNAQANAFAQLLNAYTFQLNNLQSMSKTFDAFDIIELQQAFFNSHGTKIAAIKMLMEMCQSGVEIYLPVQDNSNPALSRAFQAVNTGSSEECKIVVKNNIMGFKQAKDFIDMLVLAMTQNWEQDNEEVN